MVTESASPLRAGEASSSSQAALAALPRNGSLLMKWPWWRGVKGQIRVRGRSLDGQPGAVKVAILPYGETGFQSSALVFPGPGCWEVAGEVARSSISFVVEVEKLAEGPASKCEALFPRTA